MADPLEQHLASLYRINCPDPMTLGELVQGMLSQTETDAIERHLASCRHCRGEVAQLKTYLDLEPAASREKTKPSPLDQVRKIIALLVSGPGPTLAPAGVRGLGIVPLVYQADAWQITLEVQKEPRLPGHRQLLGIITGPPVPAWHVSVWRQEEHLATAEADDLGSFSLTDLPPGQFRLALQSNGILIQIEALQVNNG